MLKLVIYTSLALDSKLKLQILVENTVIVGQFFCFVSDVDNTIFVACSIWREILSLEYLSDAAFENFSCCEIFKGLSAFTSSVKMVTPKRKWVCNLR